MGDLANGHACDAFILAFADDIVTKFRSKLLDETFGSRVRYYVGADDNWEVHLYAAIQTGEDDGEAHFRVEGAPVFCPTADSLVDQVLEDFSDLSEDEVERRLKQGGEEAQREAERSWQETLSARAAGDGHG